VKNSHRNLVVLSSLVGVLTLTSALLLAISPPSLSPESSSSLSAVERDQLTDAVFGTEAVSQPGHWQYVYVHHSHTLSGAANALLTPDGNLPDHFVIGNGNGATDGELLISQRWNHQQAAAPAGVDKIEPTCISICLIGDLDRTAPTAAQMTRLTQLVSALQSQLRITGEHLVLLDQANSPSGIGQNFPTETFRQQILP